MSIIAILGIAGEVELLWQRLSVLATETTPAGTFWRGRWGEREVVLAQCGIGKVNAAMAAQRLMDRYAPALLLNCGSSGAIAPKLRVGDVVIADRVLPHDVGVYLARGFVTTGNALPGNRRLYWRTFPADPRLVRLAQEAAEGVSLASPSSGRPARVWVGPIASGDQVIFADGRKRWLHKTFGALAVENEGAAVVQVAMAHGLPWLVLRGISDTADAHVAFDYTRLLRYADEGSGCLSWLRYLGRKLAHLLRHPDTWTNLRRFNAGVRLVNANVAALLERLLPLL